MKGWVTLQADMGEMSRPWPGSSTGTSGLRAWRTSLTVTQIGPATLAMIAIAESVITSHGGGDCPVQIGWGEFR
jgi:hypothetical protein